MTTAIKRRRGTTAQHATFTGLESEITVDTTKDTLVVHDGATAGGYPLLREDLSNNADVITVSNTKTLSNKTFNLTSNTLSGTTAQFNTALSDGDFATLAGTETLSNKSFNDNPVFSAGTANGVAYLNGSKVLTTGSALTFDGTNLGLGTASPANFSTYNALTINGGTGGILNLQQNGTNAFRIAVDSTTTYLYEARNLPIGFYINGSEQMRLTSTGLGIGTSSPSSKLYVVGDGTFARGSATDTYVNVVNSVASFGVTQSANGSTYLYNYGAYNLYFGTGAATKMTLDSSGNLGLGVTPSAWSLGKAIEVNNAGNALWGVAASEINVSQNAYYNGGWKYGANGFATRFEQNSGQHRWHTAPSGTAGNAISFTQAMTLDASGNLMVGTTVVPSIDNTSGAYIYGSGQAQFFQSNAEPLILNRLSSTGNIALFRQGSNGTVGSISVTTTSTSFNTSSDYRLKENIQPMQNALGVVAQLNPVTYNWKADGSDGQGFIAHELQAVVPDCVTGEKDAVDKEGNPVYQGIDTSFLVGILTKAIQEQQEQINQLKAEVAALKGV